MDELFRFDDKMGSANTTLLFPKYVFHKYIQCDRLARKTNTYTGRKILKIKYKYSRALTTDFH